MQHCPYTLSVRFPQLYTVSVFNAVRLIQIGRSKLEGRLEVYYTGTWGTVCDDGFTDVEAKVACNGLGFGYVVYSPIKMMFIKTLKYRLLVRHSALGMSMLWQFATTKVESLQSQINISVKKLKVMCEACGSGCDRGRRKC